MLVTINGERAKLPDFLIVGAAKSGTTSLYAYLQQHPQIFMPKNKEPCFFSFAEVEKKGSNVIKGLDIITDFHNYLDLFKGINNSHILGEASTVYLYLYDETIKNIKKYHPNWKRLKIIIIIRDPAERAFSHYLNDSSVGSVNSSFGKMIEKLKLKTLPKSYNFIDYGFYYNQIKAYKENFDQVKIYLLEDLVANSEMVVRDLLGFLGVDISFNVDTNLKYNISMNPGNKILAKFLYKPNLLRKISGILLSKEIRHRIRNKFLENVSKKTQLESLHRKLLREIYKADILKLQDLINKDLTRWLQD